MTVCNTVDMFTLKDEEKIIPVDADGDEIAIVEDVFHNITLCKTNKKDATGQRIKANTLILKLEARWRQQL